MISNFANIANRAQAAAKAQADIQTATQRAPKLEQNVNKLQSPLNETNQRDDDVALRAMRPNMPGNFGSASQQPRDPRATEFVADAISTLGNYQADEKSFKEVITNATAMPAKSLEDDPSSAKTAMRGGINFPKLPPVLLIPPIKLPPPPPVKMPAPPPVSWITDPGFWTNPRLVDPSKSLPPITVGRPVSPDPDVPEKEPDDPVYDTSYVGRDGAYWDGESYDGKIVTPARSETPSLSSGAETARELSTQSNTTDGKRIQTIIIKTIDEGINKGVILKQELTYKKNEKGNDILISKQLVLDTSANRTSSVEVPVTGGSGGPNQTSSPIKDEVIVSANDDSLTFKINGENLQVTESMYSDISNIVSASYPIDGLTIRTGGGDDVIKIDKNMKASTTLEGGEGNDTINGGGGKDIIEGSNGTDTLDGGEGDDYINGGGDDDTTIRGGTGADILYGGSGKDIINGDQGNDYIEGGSGNDELYGDDDNDVISGGLGNDSIGSGLGNDVVYGGQGNDEVVNPGGTDTAYIQTNADKAKDIGDGTTTTKVNVDLVGTPGSRGLSIEGSDEFKERVESDIEMMRSSPTARNMLERIDSAYDLSIENGGTVDNGGIKTVIIKELQNERNGYAKTETSFNGDKSDVYLRKAGKKGSSDIKAGKGVSSVIRYNPRFEGPAKGNALVVLYHEMAHAYNNASGTMQDGVYAGKNTSDQEKDNRDKDKVGNWERQAVGLPSDGYAFDWVKGPDTKPSQNMPKEITENGLREELGLERRNSYL